MKKTIVFLLILVSANVFSQITLQFVDSISKKPATYVMVLNTNNEIITSSNEIGIVVLNKDNQLTNNIIIGSIFYERKEITLDELENNSIVFLTPKVNVLDEVVITANPLKKHLVITAYYRIYNLKDGVLSSFVDAEVKYLKKKNTFRKKVLNFRMFVNISSEIHKKDGSPYWVKKLSSTTLFEKVNKKYYLVEKGKGLINIIGKKANKVYGTIKTDLNLKHNSNKIITVNKEDKLYSIIEIEEYKSDELLTTNIKDLKYQSRTSKVIITPKMIKISPDLKGIKIKVFKEELFIQSVEYVTKKEYKKIMTMGFKDTSISHYNKKFWENLETFSPLEPIFKRQLDELLTEKK